MEPSQMYDPLSIMFMCQEKSLIYMIINWSKLFGFYGQMHHFKQT